ncbi:hypothetical protein DCC39_09875 [Pueribacillus theae]|uniref:RDD domain-containing protein n=1 Tax=Pueribacillus theae TaxID=2171751 RepID=A0A2U1K2E5_9BACI|nr:RDD family protein [Pueribacillus theae]PWA11138.1 hypothetical protein DCC39_09875 [Pueribacillus theae]
MDITSNTDLMEELDTPKQTEYVYAGFWIRFWAYLLDLLVIGSLNRIVVNPIIQIFDIEPGEPAFLPIETILTGVVFFLYFALMTKYFNQTIGKMVLGIKVISKDEKLAWDTILFREVVGRFISKALFGLVYVWVAFPPDKQGVHDYFADTWVVHTRK